MTAATTVPTAPSAPPSALDMHQQQQQVNGLLMPGGGGGGGGGSSGHAYQLQAAGGGPVSGPTALSLMVGMQRTSSLAAQSSPPEWTVLPVAVGGKGTAGYGGGGGFGVQMGSASLPPPPPPPPPPPATLPVPLMPRPGASLDQLIQALQAVAVGSGGPGPAIAGVVPNSAAVNGGDKAGASDGLVYLAPAMPAAEEALPAPLGSLPRTMLQHGAVYHTYVPHTTGPSLTPVGRVVRLSDSGGESFSFRGFASVDVPPPPPPSALAPTMHAGQDPDPPASSLNARASF